MAAGRRRSAWRRASGGRAAAGRCRSAWRRASGWCEGGGGGLAARLGGGLPGLGGRRGGLAARVGVRGGGGGGRSAWRARRGAGRRLGAPVGWRRASGRGAAAASRAARRRGPRAAARPRERFGPRPSRPSPGEERARSSASSTRALDAVGRARRAAARAGQGDPAGPPAPPGRGSGCCRVGRDRTAPRRRACTSRPSGTSSRVDLGGAGKSPFWRQSVHHAFENRPWSSSTCESMVPAHRRGARPERGGIAAIRPYR
jgi:hypothetical protein